jgi:hypothetical protein
MNVRRALVIALALLASLGAAAPARAGVAIGIGWPCYRPFHHHYYYGPRVVIAPPPVYVAPPPVYVAPAPQAVYVQPAPAAPAPTLVPRNY